MIRVTMMINEKVLGDIYAVRIKGKPGQRCTYKVQQIDYDNTALEYALGTITHDYDEGAVVLCQRLLAMWKGPR